MGYIPNVRTKHLVIEIPGMVPTIPLPLTAVPGDDEWKPTDILEGEWVWNKPDNIWYYRIDDALQSLIIGDSLSKIATISTSLVYGGEISINGVDNTKIDIAAGLGYVVNSYTNPANPVITAVPFGPFNSVSPTYISVGPGTWFTVDINGDLMQYTGTISAEKQREEFELGVAAHINNTVVETTGAFGCWSQDYNLKIIDFISALGARVNLFGNNFYENGANLRINKTEGIQFGNNVNWNVNKKDPNNITSAPETEIQFVLAQINAVLVNSQDIPVTQYDKNKDGTLVDIPDGYFVTHYIFFEPSTGLTIVQYGQFVYDSLRKAVDSFQSEDFEKIPQLQGVPVRTILAVKKGTTDLSNEFDRKFINMGRFGNEYLPKIDNYSTFSNITEAGDGLSNDKQSVTFVEDTGIVYAEVEKEGGGDMTYIFRGRDFILNCTTNTGTGGKARIALTFGESTINWGYVVPSGTTAILQNSTSEPSAEHARVYTCTIPSLTFFQARGVLASRQNTEAKEVDNRGIIPTILSKLRELGTDYRSGLGANITIDTIPDPDSVDFTVAAGVLKQIYNKTVAPLQLSVDDALVVNDETTPYTVVNDINEITTDASGVSLIGKYFPLVVAVSRNIDDTTSQLLILKPTNSYSSAEEAFYDVNGYAVSSLPNVFNNAALLFAGVFRVQANGTWNNEALAFGVNNISLLGVKPGERIGGAATAAVNEFLDNVFRIVSSANANKLSFDLGNLDQNITWTIQNKSGTPAMLSDITGGSASPEWALNTATSWDGTGYAPNMASSNVDQRTVIDTITSLIFENPTNQAAAIGRKKYVVIDNNSLNSVAIETISFGTDYNFAAGVRPLGIAAGAKIKLELFNNLGTIRCDWTIDE